MKTYLDYKNLIQGYGNVLETVKAEEKIAASAIHLLKKQVDNLNSYTSKIEQILSRLSLFYIDEEHELLQKKVGNNKALIIITGDKGKVKGLWHAMINSFLKVSQKYTMPVVIGGKGVSYLKEENIQITESFTNVLDNPDTDNLNKVKEFIFYNFSRGIFSQVDILYPQNISLSEQKPVFIPFLPFDFSNKQTNNVDYSNTSYESLGLPIFEPNKRKVFDYLLQKYIEIFFYKIITETKLAELSARTVVMENATIETKNLIKSIELDYSKERRRTITQKQLESFSVHKITR